MNKHSKALRAMPTDYVRDRETLSAAADALETLERENRKLRKAAQDAVFECLPEAEEAEVKHGREFRAGIALRRLAALSRRRAGGKRGNG